MTVPSVRKWLWCGSSTSSRAASVAGSSSGAGEETMRIGEAVERKCVGTEKTFVCHASSVGSGGAGLGEEGGESQISGLGFTGSGSVGVGAATSIGGADSCGSETRRPVHLAAEADVEAEASGGGDRWVSR